MVFCSSAPLTARCQLAPILRRRLKAKAEGRAVGAVYGVAYIPHVCSSAATMAASLETTISSG